MITVSSEAALVVSSRFNFVFSENGRYGTCLKTSDEDVALESWTLTAGQARSQMIPDVVVDGGTHALPLDDGRILLFQTGKKNPSQRHEFMLLQPRGGDFSVERLGAIPTLLWGYLLPSPSSNQLGFLVALDSEHSTIWRLSAAPPRIDRVARVPGALEGGVWLEDDASVLAVNQTHGRSRCNGIAVDLTQGSWKRIWSRSAASADRILLGSLRSKMLIVATTVSGQERLGWTVLGDPTVRFPDTLHRAGYERRALALDDHGERLLVHEVRGAISRLFIYTPAVDSLAPLTGPPGKISPPTRWTGNLLRLGFSAPTQPPTLATVRLGPRPQWSVVSREHDGEDHLPAPHAELIELEGPAGPIEAIVYGGPDWRACEHLVIALHGGPLSSWRFGFEPLFHHLSTEGVAVLAPNYRGSTGYGKEHLRAVIGHWGGPDLDDVLTLRRNLEKHRTFPQLPRPIVLGVSYGAFLALLAACYAPESWSACVALAPFLSGPRFFDSANTAVRHRIEQLGGLRVIKDGLEPRDVLHACATLSAPLLLMHGTEDDTIPVTQSRMLRRRLLELGKTEGVEFEYTEVNSDHGGLFQQKTLTRRVAHFCLTRFHLDKNRRIGSPGGPRPDQAPSHCVGKWKK